SGRHSLLKPAAPIADSTRVPASRPRGESRLPFLMVSRSPAGLAAGVLLVGSLAAPLSSAHAAIPSAAEPIVRHYLEVTGRRAARESERTLHFRGRLQTAGLKGRWEMWLAAPD